MNGRDKIMILGAAGILTTAGFLNLNRAEDIVITFLCFLSASLFLYSYFGKHQFSCSFSEINKTSEEIVLGGGDGKKKRRTLFQIGVLTFSVILLCFGVGFGIGRTLYHIVN